MRELGVAVIALAVVAASISCSSDRDLNPAPPVPHALSVFVSEGGSVTAPGRGVFAYETGTTVSLTAVADRCYQFAGWTGDVVADPSSTATTITIDSAKSVTANFALLTYNLTIGSTDGGLVNIPGEGTLTYDCGKSVDLVAQAQEGYEFVCWGGDIHTIGDVTAASTTITVDREYSVTACFALAVYDWYDLDAIRGNLGGRYLLMNDLDATTAGYAQLASPAANGGKGWKPIGTAIINRFDHQEPYSRLEPFTGMFNGQRYEIRDLFVDRPEEDAVGLFGAVDDGGIVENVGVLNVFVTGGSGVGALVGANANESIVSKAYSTGRVSGLMGVGGLVGANAYSGTVTRSYSYVTTTGFMIVGGLVGVSGYYGTVRDSYSTGSTAGEMGGVGGLIGVTAYGAAVNNCYSTGRVAGDEYVGGLVGENWLGLVSNSFWDVQACETEMSAGGAGKTTIEMLSLVTFTSTTAEGLDEPWEIVAVAVGETNPAYTWNIADGQGYPFLSWQSTSDHNDG